MTCKACEDAAAVGHIAARERQLFSSTACFIADAIRNACGHVDAKAGIPDVLFDGYSVLQALRPGEREFTSPENVSAVLDAVVSLIRLRARDRSMINAAPQEEK